MDYSNVCPFLYNIPEYRTTVSLTIKRGHFPSIKSWTHAFGKVVEFSERSDELVEVCAPSLQHAQQVYRCFPVVISDVPRQPLDPAIANQGWGRGVEGPPDTMITPTALYVRA